MLRTLSFITNHPLNREHKLSAIGRYVGWQIGSRLRSGKSIVPFVQGTKLLAAPGMTGATGNIYCGLHEFEDMALVLHALRPGELFVDAGANIGSYTVLASGVAQARTMAFEPSQVTFGHLMDNIHLNHLIDRVNPHNMALGAKAATLRFTTGLDTVNHIVSKEEAGVEVPVNPLDAMLASESSGPRVIKVDVEGFETEVLAGAQETLGCKELLAVLLELNGSGERYGYDEDKLHAGMLEKGFVPCSYAPFTRTLSKREGAGRGGNTLYVHKFEELQERLRTAAKITVNAMSF